MTITFDAKRPTEVEAFAADFTNLLGTGETISSASCVVCLATDSTEADISAMKSGSAAISGAKVTQKITGGTDGVLYTLIFQAVTSAGQTLQLMRDLPVVRDQT